MKAEDKKALLRYQEKLKRAQTAGQRVDLTESATDRLNRIKKAKQDVGFMVKTYFPHYATVESADFHLDFANRVKEDPLFKGYAEWGRGLAKSVWIDVIIPTWLWMNNETHYFCIVSDTFDRACDLLEDLRAEFEGNELLLHDFGAQKGPIWERGNFCTTSGFMAKAFGVKQKVRGLRKGSRRPDLWSIDDLETPQSIKNQKMQDDYVKWIERDLLPTMTGSRRRLIGANNRFAVRMVQTLLKEKHPDWNWIVVPAYDITTYEPAWPAMYSAEFYRQQEKDMGIVAAHSEYNHIAVIEGKIFKPEQIQWGKLPPLSEMNAIVAHWDIAYAGNKTSDYNASRIWGRHRSNFWLIDNYVKQSKMKPCVLWMCQMQAWAKSQGVMIYWQYEAQFWNDEVGRTIDEAQTETGITLNLVKVKTPSIAKLFRLVSMQPYYQNSRIYYNEDLKSNADTQVGMRQLLAVEPGMTEHDDAPDADECAIRKLELYTTPPAKQGENQPKPWKSGRIKHKYGAM